MKTFVKTIIFAVIAGLLAAFAFAGFRLIQHKNIEKTVQRVLEKHQEVMEKLEIEREAESEKNLGTTVYNVSGAANCAMPALVSIGVTSISYSYDFFGREYSYENKSNASGIIAAQNFGELLIVTNNHVVEGATKVHVTFIDGTSAEAEVKASEESEDLAVITVKIANIESDTLAKIRMATFGDSDELLPGETVIAIGNSLGYGQSVTVGHVSALNREVDMDDYTLSLIQTDVAINPGNSGGALLNARGEVVGINNAKIASESVEGICYAIPISNAIPIIEMLMTRENLPEKEQAVLGFTGQMITAEYATLYNMPKGIYVKSVQKDSAAEIAGIKEGYIIVAVNGKSIKSQEVYEKIMSYTRAGSEGTVTVKKLVEGQYVEEILNVTFGFRS